jgi:hypothetical protein
VAVAENCYEVPNVIDGLAGVIAMDTRAAGVTVRTAVPDTELDVAVMVVIPAPKLVTRPALPEVLLTVATDAADEVQ